MPAPRKLIWTQRAGEDVARLREFIQAYHSAAAKRAALRIQEAASLLLEQPAIGRPVLELPEYRDLFISFGSRGYVLRYRLEGDTVVIVRVWHFREARTE